MAFGEIWREITGYNGKYVVSNLGRIKSNNYQNTGKKQLLKGHFYKRYKRVILSRGKIHDTVLVHYAVARAFPEICGVLFEGCQIHHIDRNTENNSATNLIVVTKEQHKLMHLQDRIEQGRKRFLGKHHTKETRENLSKLKIGKKLSEETKQKIREASTGRIKSIEERKKISERRKRKTLQYTKDMVLLREFNSLGEAAEYVNRNYHTLLSCINGKCKTAGGYIWKYKN